MTQMPQMPKIRRVQPSVIAKQIIGVAPMTAPIGSIFHLRADWIKRPDVEHLGGTQFRIKCLVFGVDPKLEQIWKFIFQSVHTVEEDVVTFESTKIAMEFKLRFC